LERQDFLGLFEVDELGTVLHSSFEKMDGEPILGDDVDGLNFFNEVVPFTNAEQLRRRFESFKVQGLTASAFDFACEYRTRSTPVRVLMARIRETAKSEAIKSVLIHIRHHQKS